MKIKIEIKHYFTGAVLFEFEKEDNTIKDTLIEAVKNEANLSGANLYGANLSGANLSGANLSGADLYGAKNVLPAYDYSNLTILKNQKSPLIAYKHVTDDFMSPTNSSKLKYEIGSIVEENNCNSDVFEHCGAGLNVATLEWCLRDTGFNEEKTYIEVEFDPKDIVAIPFNTDGKFRVSKLKVLRKVTKKEINALLKPINN